MSHDILSVLGMTPAVPRRESIPSRRGPVRRPVSFPRQESGPRRSGLKSVLMEGVRSNDTVTITASECRAILRIMEEADRDPFTYRDGQFNTDDLESVGIDIPGQQSGAAAPASPRHLISPSVAVEAPHATPATGDAPPPPELAGALRTLGGEEEAVPPGGPDKYDAIAHALVHGGGSNLTDDGEDGLPPLSAPSPLPAGPAAANESLDSDAMLAVRFRNGQRKKLKQEAEAKRREAQAKKRGLHG